MSDRLFVYFSLYLLLLLTPSSLRAESKEVMEKERLVFLGDSITAGFGLDLSEAYPTLIEKKVAERGLDIEIINAGISGDTSAAGLSRLDWILRSKIDYLFVALGANDGLRGVSPAVTKANLLEIISRSRKTYPEIKIILAGCMIPPSMGKTYFDEFKSVFPEVAKQANVTLLDFLLEGVAGEPKLNQEDGIHPTADGQRIIAENVWKTLAPILTSSK